MEKVRQFFRELNEKRSYQVVFFVVSICAVLGMYAGIHARIAFQKSHKFTIVEDKNLLQCIEDVCTDEETVRVSGWSLYKNADTHKTKCQLFLRNINDVEDVIWLDTEKVARNNIDEYFDCEYDYSLSGFEASIASKKLNLEEKDYEIFIKLTYIKSNASMLQKKKRSIDVEYETTVSTKRYIIDGKLAVSYGDKENDPINIASEIMNEVLERGQQLAYNKAGDIYIYQCQDKIYWIAGQNAYFEDDGTTRIQLSYETTRPDKLPKDRVENNWDWDNASFVFEHAEITDDLCGPYRIAVQELPQNYPVTCIGTGYYFNSKLVWEEYLIPNISVFTDQ